MLALAPRKNLKNDTGKVFSQSELNIKYLIIYSQSLVKWEMMWTFMTNFFFSIILIMPMIYTGE